MEPAKNTEAEIRDVRIAISNVIADVEAKVPSRELSLVKTKLQEAKMWAGMELGNTDAAPLPDQYKDEGKGTQSSQESTGSDTEPTVDREPTNG